MLRPPGAVAVWRGWWAFTVLAVMGLAWLSTASDNSIAYTVVGLVCLVGFFSTLVWLRLRYNRILLDRDRLRVHQLLSRTVTIRRGDEADLVTVGTAAWVESAAIVCADGRRIESSVLTSDLGASMTASGVATLQHNVDRVRAWLAGEDPPRDLGPVG